MEKLLPWRRPLTGIPGSRQESDSIFTPENHITHAQIPLSQEGECIFKLVCTRRMLNKTSSLRMSDCKQFRACLPNISIGRSISLTFVSDAEACCGAAVVCREQQEQDVGGGNQEMRCLGAVVFADQGRGGRGAIPDFQRVIVDLSLEPRRQQNKKKKKAQ